MGVMQCDRMGCENIMCSRYHERHGYICDECFEELVNSGVQTDIAEFMMTEKDEPLDEKATREYFEKIFRETGF